MTDTHAPTDHPLLRLPGSPEPLQDGEQVLFTDRKGRRHLVVLRAGETWHSHAGGLELDLVIGGTEGRAIRTNRNMELTVMRPTREDLVLKMPRGAQVIYPKDQAMIVAAADIRPGCTVVEAGAGSGALSLALLAAVGPTGRVISYERREDHAEVARGNVARWHDGLPANWDLRLGDLAEDLATLAVHRVVLDLPEPWLLVDGARDALAPGGLLLTYSPSITQVMRFHQAIDADGHWTAGQTTETLVRGWDVVGLAVRPAHRMVAHTAFLTTTRRVLTRDDGGPGRRRVAPAYPHVTWVDEPAAPDDDALAAAPEA